MILDDELDLSDDIPTSSGEDEDDDIEKTLDEKDQANWSWNWTQNDAPMPAFPIDFMDESRRATLPRNAQSWRPVDFFMAMFPSQIFKMAAKETNRYASEKKHHVFETGNPAWRPVTKWKGFTFIAIQKAAGVMKVRSMQVL